jgi:murein L,D-transpeptidase YcbB/YkuD
MRTQRKFLALVATIAVGSSLALVPGHGGAQPAATPVEAALQSVADKSSLATLKRFYAARGNQPAWYDPRGLTADGRAAIAVLSRVSEEGLDPSRYRLADLTRPPATTNPAELADRDLAFSAALFRFANDMLDGRPDLRTIDRDIDLPVSGFDILGGVDRALREHRIGEFLAGLEPRVPQYAPLKAALAAYRAIAEKGGWPAIAARKKFTAASADPATFAELQTRLGAEDPALAGAAPVAVEEMDAAIRRFQARTGLDPDGAVGPGTVAALNISASDRASQIAANLERLRWLPHAFEKSYVAVNVPDATLAVVDNGSTILTSRVIVGRPHDRTPIFRAEITGIVANPPWIVPAVIARREIAPKAAADPGYLARHHMIVGNGQYRQLPGKDNALGYLKLDVSDRFSVYLHDTPSRGLFARHERFLSHGCIRVQQIRPLASYALSGDLDAGADRLNAAIATNVTTRLAVKVPLPVYVVYFTAFAAADGLQFRPDVYGRDRRLIAAMSGSTSFAQAFPTVGGCKHTA